MKAALTASARRYLRGLGHHLQPVVHCGKEGVSPALVAATVAALATHELIKVRLGDNTDGDRRELAASIAEETAAELVEVLGRTLLLYRRNPKNPIIELPKKDKKKTASTKSASGKGDAKPR